VMNKACSRESASKEKKRERGSKALRGGKIFQPFVLWSPEFRNKVALSEKPQVYPGSRIV
jgi:hypothetical protein